MFWADGAPTRADATRRTFFSSFFVLAVFSEPGLHGHCHLTNCAEHRWLALQVFLCAIFARTLWCSPYVEVDLPYEALQQGRDPQMAKALEAVGNLIGADSWGVAWHRPPGPEPDSNTC